MHFEIDISASYAKKLEEFLATVPEGEVNVACYDYLPDSFETDRERLQRIDKEVAAGTMELLDYETTMKEKRERLETACKSS